MRFTRATSIVVAAITGMLVLSSCTSAREAPPTSSEGVECAPGITDTEVNLGGSLPLSGPAAVFGVMAPAASAVFEKINDEGGLEMADGKTRTINYKYLDDGYEPARTAQNLKTLVERDQIFSAFQVFGTSNALAAREYLVTKDVPLMLVNSGASQIQEANSPDFVGFLVQYEFQANMMAQYVLDEKPNAKVGILYQNNGLGQDFLDKFTAAFDGTTAEIVSAQPYDLNASNIDSQIIALKDSGADVFLNYSAGAFMPAAIKKAHEIGWTPLQIIGTETNQIETALVPAGTDAATGVVSMVWTKDISDPQWSDDNPRTAYADLAEYAPDLDWENNQAVYTGVLQGEVMVEALRGMKGCTVKDLTDSMHSLDFESTILRPGISVVTSPDYSFIVSKAMIAEFDGESWVAVSDRIYDAVELVVGQ